MKRFIIFLFFPFFAYGQFPSLNNLVKSNNPSSFLSGKALDGSLSFTASGTNTYTVSIGLGITSINEGDILKVHIPNENTSTTVTLNVNSIGAIAVKDNAGNDPAIGALSAGGTYIVRYNGTHFRILNLGSGTIADGSVTDAKISNRTALSVFGRASNSSGVGADIAAGTDAHVLRRSGTTIGFGTIGNSSIADLAFSKLTSVPTTLSGYGITDQIFTRGGNAFGATSILGLTDNNILNIQTGNSTVNINTNGANRVAIGNTGAAVFTSAATSSAFTVNATLGAASAAQIRFQISGTDKFHIKDNGAISITPTSGAITSGSVDWTSGANTGILWAFAPSVSTTTSVIANQTSFGTYNYSTGGAGQVALAYNAKGTFAPNNGTAGAVGLLVDYTVNTSAAYVGRAIGMQISRPLTSTTGATLIGVLVTETGTVNGFGAGSNTPHSILQTYGSFSTGITNTAVDLTLTVAHHTITVDASGAARTITLPAAAGCSGRIYIIKKVDASGNNVTIDGNASETIDGATTKVHSTQYSGSAIQSDGTNWHIIGTF